MVAVDPLASLRITSTYITLAEHRFEVAGHSAADWLELIFEGALFRVIPGWIVGDEEAQKILDMLLEGDLSPEEIDEVTLEVVSIVGGRKYWWMFNLIGVAAATNTSWATLNGRLIHAGVNPKKLSLAAWIDALYAICVDGMNNEQRLNFDTQMEMPPPETPIDEEEEGEAFLALMASM